MKINRDLIKTDLYEAVNKEYLSTLEIPADKRSIGAFVKIDMDIEKQLLNDFNNVALDDEFVTPEMTNYLKFYRSIVNNKNRDLTANHPVHEVIKKITDIKTKEDLNKVLVDIRKMGITSIINLFVYASFKDSNTNIMYVEVPNNFLPSKEYYTGDQERKQELLSTFKEVMVEILNKFNVANAEDILNKALALDEKIVEYVNSAEENADYTKMYNKKSIEEIAQYSELVDFKYYINTLINKELTEISVTQPRFFENMHKIYSMENIEEIKALILVNFLFTVADLFDEDLRHIKARFSNALTGIKETINTEKFAYAKGMEIYSQVVGMYYGVKYFGEEAKKDIYSIVNKIIAMYQRRLKENPWLQEATKEKAILKLQKINVMLGYPDKLPEIYTKMTFDDSLSLYQNFMDNKIKHEEHELAKYAEPVDHTLWGMPACMVNAYYNATSNLITFPAAILNPPFYSLNQTISENYGGIGAVVGHEISHAFDNNGANFDENGNLNNWWQEDDFAEFKKLTNRMIEQFDGIEIYGGKVNGTLVVSENLADVGGLACAIACAKEEENCNLEELFANWARVWAFKGRDEYKKLLLQVDVHAPTKLRANVQASNMDEFYETFNIVEGDPMFRAKEDRINVW